MESVCSRLCTPYTTPLLQPVSAFLRHFKNAHRRLYTRARARSAARKHSSSLTENFLLCTVVRERVLRCTADARARVRRSGARDFATGRRASRADRRENFT